MYQLDSWFSVLIELLVVGFSFYNSLRMTKWWNTVKQGAEIGVRGARGAPSVADYFGIRTENGMGARSCNKDKVRSPQIGEMGDGLDAR